MSDPSHRPSQGENMHEDSADVVLQNFLLTSSGARLAASSLRPGAEVGVSFTNLPGDFRIYCSETGQVALEPVKAVEPDFELHIPPRAVYSICTRTDADIGDLGIAFFEHIKSKEPDLKINATIHSGLVKLTRRGWLGLVTRGGPKVMMWMAQKGLRGPGAIATAIGRLKS